MTPMQKHLNKLDGMKNFHFLISFNIGMRHNFHFVMCLFEVRMGISFVCTMDQEESGFSVYQGKGLTNH